MSYLNKQYLLRYLVYYSQHSEYLSAMYKQQFHDSGIVDEGLSDETGSVEEELNQVENSTGTNFAHAKKNPDLFL